MGNIPDQVTAQTLDEQNDEDPVYTAADVLDANGSPKGSNGGKDSVNADDPDADWSFESATMLDTSLNGQMTLILKKGTFDFRGSTVRCPVKIASSSAKLLGGTFTDIVCNTSGSYECINGVFLKRPEKDVDGGNVTGALRCVEMYTDSAIGDLSYTVNGKPLEGNEFYYMSYDESDGYKQEIALTCSGESPDGVAGAVVAGAVIGATGYAAVTHIWLDSIYGFVPTNRQQLALALWEKADKPQPQSSTFYSDISDEDADAQAAARRCAEQGLMKDFDEDFKPGRYVFRLQAIKAWNDLQAQLKADK